MNKSKTYVITGTTSGIGFSLLQKLGKENKVFAGFRNEDKIKNLTFGDNVIPFYIDLSNPEVIKSAAEFIMSDTEKIDTLINVAGCVTAGAVEEIEPDKIRHQFEVNTFSHLDFSQRLLPLLDGGKIINISSMASFGIFPFVAPYCASKRALDILFNSMQLECGGKFKYISIKPGVIATPLWEKSVELNSQLQKTEKYKKEYDYLIKNAIKNGKNGLNVNKVVDTILKADGTKNPKSSYTVGADAFWAGIISKLPQDLLNKLILTGMKLKFKERKN